MKKVLLTIGLILVFVAVGSAQVPKPFSLYGGGAISVPSSPDGFDQLYKTGWHGMAGFGYKMAPKFQLVGKIEYHNFASDMGALSLTGGNEKFMLFGADGRFSPSVTGAPLKPFIFGGVGLARITFDEFASDTNPLAASVLNAVLSEAQNKVYFNVGAGVDFTTGPSWSLFLQGRYVSVGTAGGSTGFIPITLGVKFF